MRYKALAIDLDGTLLIGEDLPPAHRDAVAEAASAGLEIFIATARWRQMAERVAAEIGISKPIIACSGAQVHLPTGEDIFDHRLPDAFVQELYELCNRSRCIATITLDEQVVLKLDGKPDMSLMPAEMAFVPQLDVATHGAPRIAAIQGTQVVDTIKRDLKSRYSDQVNIYDSIGPNGKLVITITARAANKGEALLAGCSHLGIDPGSVIAFGDAENDIEMFRVAGASVAMGQADDRVKQAASAVTAANTEDGVALAIRRILATGEP
ncbi:MAG: HAD family hydrolase [Pseudomonadota bacterium]